MSEDTYSPKTDPQGLNRYVYARDNPTRYVDPTGNSYLGVIENDLKHLLPVALGLLGALGNLEEDSLLVSLPVVGFLWQRQYNRDLRRVVHETSLASGLIVRIVHDFHAAELAGIAYDRIVTVVSASITKLVSNTHFRWNAAESLGILIGSVMLTTVAAINGNPILAAAFLAGDVAVFNYLDKTPNPDPTYEAHLWGDSFFQSILKQMPQYVSPR